MASFGEGAQGSSALTSVDFCLLDTQLSINKPACLLIELFWHPILCLAFLEIPSFTFHFYTFTFTELALGSQNNNLTFLSTDVFEPQALPLAYLALVHNRD